MSKQTESPTTPKTETDEDPLLQLDLASADDADEVIHIALQDLYGKMKEQGCISTEGVPILEHAPPSTTDIEDKRLIIKKIVRLKQAIR